MAKKKQEQQEQSQDEHVMAILDKRTNKTAVVSKMNEQDGSIEVVPPLTRRTMAASSNWTVPHRWNSSSPISRTSTTIPRVSVFSSYHLSFWKRH